MNKEMEAYLKLKFELARSLILKHSDIAEVMNRRLDAAFGPGSYNPNDETTWKYYLNLNGDFFGNPGEPWADQPMTIVSLDDGTNISFDKTTLANHPVTLTQYRNNTQLRENLFSQYPEQYLLIRGILFPIDNTISIPANEGEILYYDSSLVEENEEDLISDLQEEIYNIIARWYVRGFTLTDVFYLPVFLGFLATRIPVAILNIRGKYSRTYQAHSFHVKNFLASNHSLEELYPYLNKRSVMWLYRNLPYLSNATGNEDTLKDIIKKLVAENNIDVGTYYPLQTTSKDENGFPEANFIYTRLDSKGDLVQFKSLPEIIGKEVSTVASGGIHGSDATKYRLSEFTLELDTANSFNDPTKILELSASVVVDILHINPTQLVIDTWLNAVFNLDTPNHIRFIDPNDGTEYIVNNKEATMVFLKALVEIYEIQDPRFFNMTLGYVLDPTLNVTALQQLVEQNMGLDADVSHIVSLFPTLPLTVNGLPGFDTQEDLYAYLEDLFWALRRGVMFISQNQDTIDYGALKMVFRSVFSPIEVDLNAGLGLTNGDLLSAYNQTNLPRMDTPGYDKKELLISLLEAVTGYVLPLPNSNNGLYDSIIEALGHLTAYSTQKIANFLSLNLLANLEYPFSRLSEPLSEIFLPEIALDCTPRGLAPDVEIACSELDLGLNVILLDETKISSLCFEGVIKSPTFCTDDGAWAISECFGTTTWTITGCVNSEPVALGEQDTSGPFTGGKQDGSDPVLLGKQTDKVIIPAIADLGEFSVTYGGQYTYIYVTYVGCANADPDTPVFCSDSTPTTGMECKAPHESLPELPSYTSKTGIKCSPIPRPTLNMSCSCGDVADILVYGPNVAEDPGAGGGGGFGGPGGGLPPNA